MHSEQKGTEYSASGLVDLRARGLLKLVSNQMHLTFLKLEKVIKEHYNAGQLYARDAFESIICDISSLCLPKLCCDVHRDTIVPQLIYEFRVIRCRLLGKS